MPTRTTIGCVVDAARWDKPVVGVASELARRWAPELFCVVASVVAVAAPAAEANSAYVAGPGEVFETTFHSEKRYPRPFVDVEVDVVFQLQDEQWTMPAFWNGPQRWTVRFAPPRQGLYRYRVLCTDKSNASLHGTEGNLEVGSQSSKTPLLKHSGLRVSTDRRHFEHADGKPFLWLADTWWKNLCQRMTWEGFQELTADRKAKGFNVVQIVCGPYPDEGMMDPRWENEGGKPYETRDFSVVNPRYFEFADRRIEHLVRSGIVPAIVGGWGRPQQGGASTLAQVGLEGYQRHWRHLVARYGALPVVWIVGGEAKDAYGPWSRLAAYLKTVDPYGRLVCYHAPGHPRQQLQDNSMFDFDMVAPGHAGMKTVEEVAALMQSCLRAVPKRPVLCGEACYEAHMQSNFQYLQRYMFWRFMLSGAAGHTYGAAGVWHASVQGDPGIEPVYDWTTWREGMNLPGSTQLGLGKKLLEAYPWQRFETHPEWAEAGAFAAGIPGKLRVIYQPRREIYDWTGVAVKQLQPGESYQAFYFDPASGRRFELGVVVDPQGDYRAPAVPSPQDWVLVLQRVDDQSAGPSG